MKKRNSNFELMRIISMFLIVLWHVIIHGHTLDNSYNGHITILLKLIEFIIIIHVNSFVILSGYYQSKSKFRFSKLLSLIIQVIFYSSIIYLIGAKLNIIEFNTNAFINTLLPSTINDYWFIKAYIALYILSDIINLTINAMDQKTYKNVLTLLFILFSTLPFLTGQRFFDNNGSTFYNFIFLYMIGGYISKYGIKKLDSFSQKKYYLVLTFIFLSMAILNFIIIELCTRGINVNPIINDISYKILCTKLTFTPPMVVIQSICYLLVFKNLNLKSKLINYISSCTFGIYLFHDNHCWIRQNIYVFFKIDNGSFSSYSIFIKILIVAIIIFIIGVIIETLRKLIFKLFLKIKPVEKLCKKIQELDYLLKIK